MDLRETSLLGDRAGSHWYYRSKARAMQRMLGPQPVGTVLDVGAGSGFFARHLLARDAAHRAWCVDTAYDGSRDTLEAGRPLHFRQAVDRCDADLVLMMDVLEHVDDDVGLLTAYAARVPSGARFLVSVPAFESLWSGHDVFLGHRRRYRLAQLEGRIQQAGLVLLAGAYYFGALFPVVAALRLAARLRPVDPRSDLRVHPTWLNSALAALCTAELPLMRLNRLAGLSAFCLARKP